MTAFNQLFTAMLTRNTNDAGTDSSVMLIGNVNHVDRMQYNFPDTPQDDQERAQANYYPISLQGSPYFDTTQLAETYFRVGIRGDDAWAPEHFFVWGTTQSPATVVPLAISLNIHSEALIKLNGSGPTWDQTVKNMVLSTDSGEGYLSFPLNPVAVGNARTKIRTLLVVMLTGNRNDDGTDSTINLKIVGNETPTTEATFVDFTFPDTAQEEQEKGQANWYFIPVDVPFSKSQLLGADKSLGIRLSIEGDDAWKPASFFIFGFEQAGVGNGRVDVSKGGSHIEPLVHIPTWTLGALSTDDAGAKPFYKLPLVP